MSGDAGAIKRVAATPPGGVSAQPSVPPASPASAGRASRVVSRPLAPELPQEAPAELSPSLDARLAERVHALLLSPALASMTQRASVLHSVVSWLKAQSPPEEDALSPVIEALEQEILLIEAFHRGALHDVEGPRQ